MRFRPATECDVAAIAAKFEGRNSLPLEPRVRAALPALVRQLVCSPAATTNAMKPSWPMMLNPSLSIWLAMAMPPRL